MGLYDFKPQFVPFIKSGEKTHTIRSVRKHPSKPGDTLYLYCGLRRKGAKKIMEAECVKVEDIEIVELIIDRDDDNDEAEHIESALVRIDDVELTEDECEQLARRDGFSSFAEMVLFWTKPQKRLPFVGHIIHWRRNNDTRKTRR